MDVVHAVFLGVQVTCRQIMDGRFAAVDVVIAGTIAGERVLRQIPHSERIDGATRTDHLRSRLPRSVSLVGHPRHLHQVVPCVLPMTVLGLQAAPSSHPLTLIVDRILPALVHRLHLLNASLDNRFSANLDLLLLDGQVIGNVQGTLDASSQTHVGFSATLEQGHRVVRSGDPHTRSVIARCRYKLSRAVSLLLSAKMTRLYYPIDRTCDRGNALLGQIARGCHRLGLHLVNGFGGLWIANGGQRVAHDFCSHHTT